MKQGETVGVAEQRPMAKRTDGDGRTEGAGMKWRNHYRERRYCIGCGGFRTFRALLPDIDERLVNHA